MFNRLVGMQNMTATLENNIGFPCYLQVEPAYDYFCKLKWHKVKKQLP